MADFNGKFSGDELESRIEKIKGMVGATASGPGEGGLVPAPAIGDDAKFLCGDGKYKSPCEIECVKNIAKDVDELKMLNSHDYYVAGWVDGDLSPNAVEFHGDREFANKWNVYLLDTTDNVGETTTPIGKLMRGNLLRFENGGYAPTVGITEDMRSQCDVALYTDTSASSLAYAAGAYDAVAEWEIDKGLIQSGLPPEGFVCSVRAGGIPQASAVGDDRDQVFYWHGSR